MSTGPTAIRGHASRNSSQLTSWSSCLGNGRPGTGPGWRSRCGYSAGCASCFPASRGSPVATLYRISASCARKRAFPARTLKPAEVLSQLAGRSVSASVLPEAERVLAGRSLSRFQLDAAAEIFAALRSGNDRGIVVGAGTGSGKTLAFYLPALAQLAARGVPSPRVVAIYPRNELLKDQLATAMQEVRSLRAAGRPRARRRSLFRPHAEHCH